MIGEVRLSYPTTLLVSLFLTIVFIFISLSLYYDHQDKNSAVRKPHFLYVGDYLCNLLLWSPLMSKNSLKFADNGISLISNASSRLHKNLTVSSRCLNFINVSLFNIENKQNSLLVSENKIMTGLNRLKPSDLC